MTDIKINPLYPVDAFIVDAKTFKRYEDLSSMTSEDINRQLAVDVGEDKLSGKSPPDVPMSFWFVPTAETFPMTEDKLMIRNINTIQVDDIFLDSS